MLVLNRKLNEKVIIGDNITVTVLEVKRDSVKLGFDGPKDVPIDREEVRIRKQNNESKRAEVLTGN